MVNYAVLFVLMLKYICFMMKGIMFITILVLVCSGLTAFAAALIYTLHHKEILQVSKESLSGHFGYCFILAWVCVPLLLCSGIMYIHLRKKQ